MSDRERDDSALSRRGFLCRAARWLGLAAIGGAAATLLARGRGAKPSLELCRRCPELGGCADPEAELARRTGPSPSGPLAGGALCRFFREDGGGGAS